MPEFPFVYNMSTGRAYYGPSLQDPQSQKPLWMTEEQKGYYETSHPKSNLFAAALTIGGIAASGFIPTGGGGRMWDWYVRGLRTIEEYSPGQILRTFQLSAFFSQFETVAKGAVNMTPDMLSKNQPYAHYLAKLIGTPEAYSKIMTEGISLEGGKLFYGKGDIALKYAAAVRVPEEASAYWGSAYARSIGATEAFTVGKGAGDIRYTAGRKVPFAHEFFAKSRPFMGNPRVMNPMLGGMPAQIIGGRNLPQYISRQASAWGTEFVSRFNRLLKMPFEMQPFKSVFGRLQAGVEGITGKRIEFAVKEAAGSKMLGALALKYGLGLGAIYMGYRTLDWATRSSELLDNTVLAEGLTAGIATLGVRGNLLLSRAAEITGLHAYREAQEDIAPGSTDLKKLLAFPLIGGMGAGFAAYLAKSASIAKLQWQGMPVHEARRLADKKLTEFGGKGIVSRVGRALTRQSGLYSRQDWIGKIMRLVAQPARDGEITYKMLGRMGPAKLATVLGMGLGAALVAPFLPGALIPSTRPEELEAIYSGEEEVPVRKGRWWEFGRSPFEGKRIMYYRPHWYPRMLMRAREKAIWGEEEDQLSPLSKWYRSEFTYDLEEQHYRDRPYPITSLPFEDVPLIGPILAHTIGKIIKPPMLMHEEEWMSDRGVKAMPPRFGGRVATEIGEEPGGLPISPFGHEGLVGEQAYRLTEMIGLPGFAMVSAKEALTGTGDLYDQVAQLESARRIAGFERFYWDLELGGLLGTTEAFRRLYPHRRRQIPLYNPIRNTMPEWLPGPGEKSPDFLHGDPYCIASETLVETLRHGFIRVDELHKGDWIKSHKGRWLPVKKIIRREMNLGEKLFEIKVTSLAAFPIKASEEHPFWTPEGWTEAKDLKVGDYVGYPLGNSNSPVRYQKWTCDLEPYLEEDLPVVGDWIYMLGSWEYAECVDFIERNPGPYPNRKEILEENGWSAKTFENAQRGVKNGTLKRFPVKFNMSSREWGIVAGYYLSEGSVTGHQISFAFHQNETKYHQELLQAFEALWGVKGHVYPASTGNGCNVVFHNKILAGFIPKILGTTFDKKRILSSKESVPDLLRCLFNGDGSFYLDQGKPRLSLKLKNLKLLWQVREILLNHYNCVAYINEDHLVIRGQAAKDLALSLGTKYKECSDSSRTVRHTYIKDGYVWMRIFSKKDVPQEPVYGIEVDHDDSFCVVGVATHNTKVPEGELRLPGVGYAQRFTELAGVKPEDYPLVHKYKILADVAPWSDKFKQHRQMVRAARKKDWWGEQEERIYQMTEEQLKKKKKRTEFQEYEYLTPMGELLGNRARWGAEEGSSLVTVLNEQARQKEETGEGPGVVKKLFGGYWELLAHNAETAMDQLTPVSPASKFLHIRTAIEHYERMQLYGTENAFWQHPLRDFIRPFTNLLGRGFGFTDAPEHVQERRHLEQYFDVLKYVKNSRLANLARAAGDHEAVKEFEAKKDQTLFGINPYTRNYTSIFRALPRRDRDYFNSFADARTPEERAKILEMVPDNEKGLYIARWKLAFADEIKKAKKAGILSEDQLNEADNILDNIYEDARTEGFPTSQELYAEYVETRLRGESYGDWYRRTRLLSKLPALPGPDWVGWHPSVDLEDIKLRVVQTIGEDMHDYDIWRDQARALVNKPYINDEAVRDIISPEELTGDEIRDRINELLASNQVRGDVFVRNVESPGVSSIDVDVEQDPDIDEETRRAFF